MTLSDIGALGEFLGFFAVLATLIYLGIQTRQSKDIAKGEAAREIVMNFLSVWSELVKDEELSRLARIGINEWGALQTHGDVTLHRVIR